MTALERAFRREAARQIASFGELQICVEPAVFGWLVQRCPAGLWSDGNAVDIPFKFNDGLRATVTAFTWAEGAADPRCDHRYYPEACCDEEDEEEDRDDWGGPG